MVTSVPPGDRHRRDVSTVVGTAGPVGEDEAESGHGHDHGGDAGQKPETTMRRWRGHRPGGVGPAGDGDRLLGDGPEGRRSRCSMVSVSLMSTLFVIVPVRGADST
jgi:hypothetical protein